MIREQFSFSNGVGLLINNDLFCERDKVSLVKTEKKEYLVLDNPAEKQRYGVYFDELFGYDKFIDKENKKKLDSLPEFIFFFVRLNRNEWIDVEKIRILSEVYEYPEFMSKTEDEAKEEKEKAQEEVNKILQEAEREFYKEREKRKMEIEEKKRNRPWNRLIRYFKNYK